MMQAEKLFRAIGAVGDDLIARADEPVKRQPVTWGKWAALAACCVLVLGAAALAMPGLLFGAGSSAPADAPPTASARITAEDAAETEAYGEALAQQPAAVREMPAEELPLTLEVQPQTLTRNAASFTLTNRSGQRCTLAGGYTLEREQDGLWLELPPRTKLAVDHASSFDEQYTLVCDFSARYAQLTDGHYRLVQPVTLADGSAYTLYAEFTLEE